MRAIAAITAAANKKKSPPTKRCELGFSVCLLIGQPFFKNRSIMRFHLDEFDAHSFAAHVICHSSYGRKLGASVFNTQTYSTSLGKRDCGLNEAAASAQIAGN